MERTPLFHRSFTQKAYPSDRARCLYDAPKGFGSHSIPGCHRALHDRLAVLLAVLPTLSTTFDAGLKPAIAPAEVLDPKLKVFAVCSFWIKSVPSGLPARISRPDFRFHILQSQTPPTLPTDSPLAALAKANARQLITTCCRFFPEGVEFRS